MQRIFAIVLTVALSITLLVVPVSAETQTLSLEQAMQEAILNYEESLDISKYNADYNIINKTYSHLINYNPLLYYVSDIKIKFINGVAKEIMFSYRYTKEQVDFVTCYAYENFLKYTDKDWSDLEKVVYIHDAMCASFQYDRRLFKTETASAVGRNVYDMFKDGTGVCQAYSNTFKYLMYNLGVETRLIASSDANHEWNAVKIDGEWYHIDVTYDDPVFANSETYERFETDLPAYVRRKYFLKSDKDIYDKNKDGDHYNWVCLEGDDIECNSNRFNGSYDFDEAVSPYAYANGKWYFFEIDSRGIELKETDDFKRDTELLTLSDKWAYNGKYYYRGCYSGLISAGNWLIYNTDSSVEAFNVVTKSKKTLFDLKDLAERDDIMLCGSNQKTKLGEDMFIFGIRREADTIYCQFAKDPGKASGSLCVKIDFCEYGHIEVSDFVTVLEPTETIDGKKEKSCFVCKEVVESKVIPSKNSIKPGDCSCDGKIDTTDLAMLKKAVASLNVAAQNSFDCNKDNCVDTTDLAILKKFVAGLIKELF